MERLCNDCDDLIFCNNKELVDQLNDC